MKPPRALSQGEQAHGAICHHSHAPCRLKTLAGVAPPRRSASPCLAPSPPLPSRPRHLRSLCRRARYLLVSPVCQIVHRSARSIFTDESATVRHRLRQLPPPIVRSISNRSDRLDRSQYRSNPSGPHLFAKKPSSFLVLQKYPSAVAGFLVVWYFCCV